MIRLTYDVETNGFLATVSKIHCIVTEDITTGTIQVFHDHPTFQPKDGTVRDGVTLLRRADVVAGHNISGFDQKVLDKLYPDIQTNPNQIEIDTICLSRLLYPERYQHTLESWAKTLKLPIQKTQNEDWTELTQNVLTRCIGDVRMNTMVLKHMQGVIKEHDAEGTKWLNPLYLEQAVSKIHADQTVHGVMYNVELAQQRRDEFDVLLDELREKITKEAPHHVESPVASLTVAKLDKLREDPFTYDPGVTKVFTKDGLPTAQTCKWFEDTCHDIETVMGPYSRIKFVPINLNSDRQVKNFLFTLGWKPDEWNGKRVNGQFITTSPKLTESSYGSLPPGLGQEIKLYNTIKHRRGLIQSPKHEHKGALGKVRPDGRVQAEAITCGTPTARYTHSGAVCNIPRPSSTYGGEIRELFGVHPDNLMVGIDLSGIEARMLAHFCFRYPGGPEFAELVTTGDWHSENADLWNCERIDAKSELYALMYGAGPLKLGNILGRSAAVGKRNKKEFLEKYKPYALLVKDLEREMAANDGWITALDGRRFYVRTKKDVLNTCLQGNSAIIFKHWMVRVNKMNFRHRFEQIIAYHDELQFELYSNNRSEASLFGHQVCNIAEQVGREFKINVPIEAEAKVGMNWKECH